MCVSERCIFAFGLTFCTPLIHHRRTHNTTFLVIALIACLAFPLALPAADTNADIGNILTAAESVFQNMEKRDYPALWNGLSAETRRSIIKSVGKALGKAGRDVAEERIQADFEQGGEIAREYWGAYLTQFDPKTVLEESKWTMGEIKKDKAEILLRYRKSEYDAILKLFREEGAWKVGLDETFSTRQ